MIKMSDRTANILMFIGLVLAGYATYLALFELF
jgi:hypothetical protein